MDILSYIVPKSRMISETEYDKGRVFAYKSMINIYDVLRKNYDQTLQSIYFFAYTTRMSKMCGERDEEFARGQVDAYNDVFNHFKPRQHTSSPRPSN